MKIQCPQCGVKGSTEDSYCGMRVKCPKCLEIFEVVPPTTAKAPLEDVVPTATYVDKPVESSAPIDQVLPEERQEKSEQQADVTENPVAADSGSLRRDLTEVLGAEAVPENDLSQVEASANPLGDEGENTLDTPLVEQRDEEAAEASAPFGEEPQAIVQPSIVSGLMEEQGTEKILLDGVEDKPYGMDKEQCWQCGKKDSVGVPFIAKDGRLYCPDCLRPETPECDELGAIPKDSVREDAGHTETSPQEPRYSFTIGGLLRGIGNFFRRS
jgi:hypothetical protein